MSRRSLRSFLFLWNNQDHYYPVYFTNSVYIDLCSLHVNKDRRV